MTRDPRLKNKWWRLTHLYKIRNKRGELVVFKPNFIQLLILSKLGERLRARFLKYRQGGVTTLFAILYLDDAVWTSGFSAAIIAHDRPTIGKIFQIVKRAYENMPESVKPTTKQNTLYSYRFERSFDGQILDSEIYVDMKLRGGTVQALHISERAYIEGEKSQELEAGSKQAVPIHGRITEETTANGYNEFYDSFSEDYQNLVPAELDYAAMFFAWHEDPLNRLPGSVSERTENDNILDKLVFNNYNKHLDDEQILWYNWKEKELIMAARESDDKIGLSGRQLMRQEYPSTWRESFQSGLGNVFDAILLDSYKPAAPIRIIHSRKFPGEKIVILVEPVKEGQEYFDDEGKRQVYRQNHRYFIGCDPSDGMGDPAGIAVWNEDYVKCAQWKGLLRPDLLAELVQEIAEMYNNAFTGVENNMLSTILFLSKSYTNIFSTITLDKTHNTRTKKIGWTTTGKSRDVMIDDFVMHFEEGTLQNLTAESLGEMQTFIRKEGGKREHASGKHDDVLFGDMIAIQMIKNKDKAKAQQTVFESKPTGF